MCDLLTRWLFSGSAQVDQDNSLTTVAKYEHKPLPSVSMEASVSVRPIDRFFLYAFLVLRLWFLKIQEKKKSSSSVYGRIDPISILLIGKIMCTPSCRAWGYYHRTYVVLCMCLQLFCNNTEQINCNSLSVLLWGNIRCFLVHQKYAVSELKVCSL